MQVSDWSVFLLLLKLASYLAVLALAGTLLMRLLNDSSNTEDASVTNFYQELKRWQITCVAVGFVASILQVPIEAGAMAESGISGMIDPFMLEIVWQSVIGDQAIFRISAFFIALIAVCTWQTTTDSTWFINFSITLLILGFITYSFTFTGHSADKGILVKSILTLHIMAIASWVGSLWPLYRSCKLLPISVVKKLMEDFGQVAIIIVSVLILSGITLLLQYLNSFSELFTSNYGQLILLKLFFVSGMLLLGAWHKISLVPQITQQQNIDKLKRSISVEMFIALFVLIITSVFTTLVGPSY
ncbi:MAG: CopD family protein [Colwellia sp.]|nr:CopD family protein [Colwellia sp.]